MGDNSANVHLKTECSYFLSSAEASNECRGSCLPEEYDQFLCEDFVFQPTIPISCRAVVGTMAKTYLHSIVHSSNFLFRKDDFPSYPPTASVWPRINSQTWIVLCVIFPGTTTTYVSRNSFPAIAHIPLMMAPSLRLLFIKLLSHDCNQRTPDHRR